MPSAQKRGEPGLLQTWGSTAFPLGKCLPAVSLHALTGGRHETTGKEQKKNYKSQMLITENPPPTGSKEARRMGCF